MAIVLSARHNLSLDIHGDTAYAERMKSSLYERPPEEFDKPFDVLLPIMSRLPQAYDEIEEETILGASELDYIHLHKDTQIAGALSYNPINDGLKYTSSRLPRIDEASRAIWTTLHGLRPLSQSTTTLTRIAQRTPQLPPHHPISSYFAHDECPFAKTTTTKNLSHQETEAISIIRSLFNWSTLHLPKSTNATFYGVVFRSKRLPGSESTNLYAADRMAHEEAVRSGGLLMYFYGAPEVNTGVNLATCVWSSREDAKIASRLPLHKLAVEHARKAYQWFELERYAVVKREGETEVRIESWVDHP